MEPPTTTATAAEPGIGSLRRYTVLLTPDDEAGGYGVTVPALPGCFTQGDTVEEALANAREAISGHVAALQQEGLPVPEERPLSVLAQIEV